jgi:hypothetical protein
MSHAIKPPPLMAEHRDQRLSSRVLCNVAGTTKISWGYPA